MLFQITASLYDLQLLIRLLFCLLYILAYPNFVSILIAYFFVHILNGRHQMEIYSVSKLTFLTIKRVFNSYYVMYQEQLIVGGLMM
jgi:hypothetical protein